MEIGKLKVQRRHDTGKGISRRLRAQGFVPGTCYGAGLDEALSISVDPKALKESLDPIKRQNTVLTLTIENDDASRGEMLAMLWDYQIHPRRREVTHVDLITIDPAKEIEVEVPVELKGKPAGAVNNGQLNIARHQLLIRCKPAVVPGRIAVDVSPLNIGDTIHVSDVTFPEGVTPAIAPELTIVTCVAPESEALVAAGGEEGAEGEAAAEGGESSSS
jgi:large subunit ribosomal protein L25